MLRKVAIALLAATMFTAPVLAQGTGGATATPPASSQPAKNAVNGGIPGAKAQTTTAKNLNSKSIKTVKTHKHVRKHARKHTAGAKHVKAMKPMKASKHARHHAHGKRSPVAVRAGAKIAGKPATRTGTN
jgi:hypothetical protein